MTDAFTLLTQGKILEAILQTYSSMMGEANFFLLLVAISVGLTYMKTRSVELVGMVMMLSGSVLMPVVTPDARIYFLAIIMLGAAVSIYNLVWRKYG